MLNHGKKLLLIAALGLAFSAPICAMQSQEEKDKLGGKLREMAIMHGKIEDFRNLISQGANINSQNHVLMTPLMLAAYNGNVDMVEELIHHKANLDIQQIAGLTALTLPLSMSGISRFHEQVVRELIRAGANIYISSNSGETALIDVSRYYAAQTPEQLRIRANIARMILEKATTLTNDDRSAIKNWLLVNQRLGQEQRNLPKDPRTIVAQKIYESLPGLLRERVIRAGAIEALVGTKDNYHPNPEMAQLIEQYLNLNFLAQRIREQLPWISSTLPHIQGK